MQSGSDRIRGRRRFLGMTGGVVAGAMTGAVPGPIGADARDAGATRRAHRMYLGSYGHGISLVTADPATGRPADVRTVADTPEPSYLALAPDRRFLYAANELDAGTVTAFAVAADGGLTPLGSRPSHGAHPCHVHVHPSGRYVLTANYTSGNVAVHPVTDSGALAEASDVVRHTGSGPDPERQEGPHAHQILTGPGGFVHAVDLGADTVFTYRLERGELRPAGELRVRPGAGPRHLRFHPSGRTGYLTDELASTVTTCRYDPERGRLTPVQTLPAAPETGVRNYPSELAVFAGGRYLYVANRGHNSVAGFAVDGDRLTALGTTPCGGDWPRHLAFSHDGRHLYAANQRSGDLATLGVDPLDGSLRPGAPATPAGTPTMLLPV